MKLVIVESPSKTKTIEKYLGEDFLVLSSKGHIRDLATSGKGGLGIDVDNEFTPTYKNLSDKKAVIKELTTAVKKADEVFLATDPDREGEAISWHVAEVLGLDLNKTKRVVFNEITKTAVLDAFSHPRSIDMDLVSAQETRRFLDRIIGFKLSKLLQKKIQSRSAGRVQSVVLKLIVDREREIEAFIPEEYWTIDALFKGFTASLAKYKNKKIELVSKEQTDEVLNNLDSEFLISSVASKIRNKNSKPPFITSTLQQEASSKIGFNSKKTMRIAQKLYEGIDIGSETVGLISYMRTDSIHLSNEFIAQTKAYILDEFGKEYVGEGHFRKKKQNEQQAHEAIRPTSIYRTPGSLEKHLTKDELKLYSFIYFRTLASLMSNAKVDATTVELLNNDYMFKATGNIMVFDGYYKVYAEYEQLSDGVLPVLVENEKITADKVDPQQHFTQPPARYSESGIVKAMEENGIGRPSTYVQTITTLQARNYVVLEQKRFLPTEQGIKTNDVLQEYFGKIINVEYTSQMETDLDNIALATDTQLRLLTEFYFPFDEMINSADDAMEKFVPVETGEMCPECGSPLVLRKGRYGEFVACSAFPKCKYVKAEKREVKKVIDCPKCDGVIVEKRTKRGKIMYGCSNYPDCDFASWYKPIEEKCPQCQSTLVKAGKKIKCMSCEYERADE